MWKVIMIFDEGREDVGTATAIYTYEDGSVFVFSHRISLSDQQAFCEKAVYSRKEAVSVQTANKDLADKMTTLINGLEVK